jgi:hypothetical protein
MFAFWLASGNTVINYLALGHDSSDLEMKLRGCLDRLRAIGASSAMSVKAHRCLQRHLDVLSNKGGVYRLLIIYSLLQQFTDLH